MQVVQFLLDFFREPVVESFQFLLTLLLFIALALFVEATIGNVQWVQVPLLLIVFVTALELLMDCFVLMKNLLTVFNHFFLAFIPFMTSIFALLQSVWAFLAWSPMLVIFIEFLLYVCNRWLLPLLQISLLLSVVSRLIPQMSFHRLAELIRKSVLSIVSASLVAISSVLSIASVAFFSFDSIKGSVKRMIEQNVPFIGSVLTESLSLLQRFQSTATTGIGFATIGAFIFISFYPVCRLLLAAFTVKLCAGIAEPFVGEPISGLLEDCSKVLFVLCGVALLLTIGYIMMWLLLYAIVQIGVGKTF